MGLIILPFLFVALGFSVFALINTIRLLKKKEIGYKEILWGLGISISIFALICLSYIIEGKASGFSPAFRIPIFMIFFPFGLYLLTKINKNQKTIKYIGILVLISIGLTGILAVIFNEFFFSLIDLLGIEKLH